MVAVFEYRPNVNSYQMLMPLSDRTFERLRDISDEDVAKWIPPNLRWYGSAPKGDFPNLAAHFPIASERALKVILPLIEEQVDLLEVNVPDGGYTGLHVRNIVDCLDVEKSDIVWFEPGRAMNIEKYVFHSERLAGQHLFRIPELKLARAFLSGELMTKIEESGLEGLQSVKLWEA